VIIGMLLSHLSRASTGVDLSCSASKYLAERLINS
jgi:hypothetical protein